MQDAPFCGPPPDPAEIWSRWTLEPLLLAGLGLALIAALTLAPARRRALGGWGLTALAFVSPLCALSMSLFAARVGQHLVLVLLAAPLLALAFGEAWRRVPPLPAAAAFGALFWIWHAPGPYAATLAHDGIYWLMHLSLLGAAAALWGALLEARAERLPQALLATVLTGAQMSVLGAMLALSGRVWHGWHDMFAPAWGLTGAEDQQLAGVAMWVAGGLVMTALAGSLAARWMTRIVPAQPAAAGPPGPPGPRSTGAADRAGRSPAASRSSGN